MNIRSQFPQLQDQHEGQPLVYLDSAATTLKPKSVIANLTDSYLHQVANVHRGAHLLSDRGTRRYEGIRHQVAQFLNASSDAEVIFTHGTTEGINLVAFSLSQFYFSPGDEILLTEMEHHSNLIPWQIIAKRCGLVLKFIPINPVGELDLSTLDELITTKTKMVSLVHCSNSLGTVNDVKQVTKAAKKVQALVLIDGAQAVSAFPVDVRDIGCDFYVFSGHKLFAPTGVGILWGREELLNQMPPFQSGGSMISEVDWQESQFLPSPQRFEAGTPHIHGVYGLGAALDFLTEIGFSQIAEIESDNLNYAQKQLAKVSGLKFVGTASSKVNIISFLIEGTHPSDVSTLLDQQGVAVRVGHHCTQPLMKKLGITGTVRASLSIYTIREDIDRLVFAIEKAKELLL